MIDEMDLGFVALHMLHHGQNQDVTPGWMADELGNHGYMYDIDEVERVLRNLVAKGLMETDEEQFWTTRDGDDYLAEQIDKIIELHDEVV